MELLDYWKPVVGFEGKYEVSVTGQVRSVERTVIAKNRWGTLSPRFYPTKQLVAYINVERGRYRYVNLHDGGQHMCRVAVLVAAAFIGPRPSGLVVCYNNGVSIDDRATNLRYDTAKNNAIDMMAHGTRLFGAAHPAAKLVRSDVLFIREQARSGASQAALADVFGVSQQHISNIATLKRWAHA